MAIQIQGINEVFFLTRHWVLTTYRQNYGQVFNNRGLQIRDLYSVVPLEPHTRFLLDPYPLPTFYDLSLIGMQIGLWVVFWTDNPKGIFARPEFWAFIVLVCSLAAFWYLGRASTKRAASGVLGMQIALWIGYSIAKQIDGTLSQSQCWAFIVFAVAIGVLGMSGMAILNRAELMKHPRDRDGGDVPLQTLRSL
jgi:hypothetical protein